MSMSQRTRARMITVDRATADVLRLEVKKVVMFEHDAFEDFLDFIPDAQHGLAMRYRGAFDLIDALGWDPEKADPAATTYDVPLSDDLIDLLRLRRYDLALANVDRLPERNGPISPELLAEITVDRLAQGALDRLFRRWESTS